uniref:PBP1A family penicillin-binding protein n=1 Tax=candidate division WOR-3 bacterium TaxID=2052148 RepID=A0A7C4GAG4_UNCW3
MKRAIISVTIAAVAVLTAGFAAYAHLRSGLPSAGAIENYRAPASTRVLDCRGRLIAEFFQERRRPVALESIPSALREAIVAVEDKRFYSHWGIDIIRVCGSILANITRPGRLQGASTITQQLARSMFLTYERKLTRKMREMVLAVELERHYSKSEILEMYLNQVWFGGSVYGVAAAAERYFGKPVSRLDPVECATLGAMLANPPVYSPYRHPDRLLNRRNYFLRKLRDAGRLNQEQYSAAIARPLDVQPARGQRNEAPYFVEDVRRYLMDKYGSEFVYKSGATVRTTLDLDMQAAANQALLDWLDQIERDYGLRPKKATYDSVSAVDTTARPPEYLQGALVCLDIPTGEVRAMIGGRDFGQSEYNRASQSRRQAGSAFKPFLYVAAIDNGMTPADIETDSTVIISLPGQPIYVPQNYDGKMLGPMTLRRALALSRNLVAVRLVQKLGPELMARYAHQLGITSRLPAVYSLALGAAEVTLLELTAAFNTFANAGVRVQPLLVKSVEDANGVTLEQNHAFQQPVLSPTTAFVITNMLQSVVNEGTATSIRARGFIGSAAGKTGTTDDYADAWFVGYTPALCCGVWVGFDRRRTIFRGATGGGVAAPAWAEFMKQVDTTTVGFTVPEDVVTRPVCELTGLLATPACPRVRYEVFTKGTEPARSCPVHQ